MWCLVNIPDGKTLGVKCDAKAIGQECLAKVFLIYDLSLNPYLHVE